MFTQLELDALAEFFKQADLQPYKIKELALLKDELAKAQTAVEQALNEQIALPAGLTHTFNITDTGRPYVHIPNLEGKVVLPPILLRTTGIVALCLNRDMKLAKQYLQMYQQALEWDYVLAANNLARGLHPKNNTQHRQDIQNYMDASCLLGAALVLDDDMNNPFIFREISQIYKAHFANDPNNTAAKIIYAIAKRYYGAMLYRQTLDSKDTRSISGQYTLALEYVNDSIELLHALNTENLLDSEKSESLYYGGLILMAMKDAEGAREYFNQSLYLFEHAMSDNTLDDAAGSKIATQKFMLKLIDIKMFNFDRDDPNTHASSQQLLSTATEYLHQYLENQKQNSLKIKLDTNNSLLLAQISLRVGNFFTHQKRNGKVALSYLNTAKDLLDELPLAPKTLKAEVLAQRGFAHHLEKDYKSSEQDINTLINTYGTQQECAWWVAFGYCVRTLSLSDQKQYPQALQQANYAMQIYTDSNKLDSPQCLSFSNRVANLYFDQANLAYSEKKLELAHELFNSAISLQKETLSRWLEKPDFIKNFATLRTVLNLIQSFVELPEDLSSLISIDEAIEYKNMAITLINNIGLTHCGLDLEKLKTLTPQFNKKIGLMMPPINTLPLHTAQQTAIHSPAVEFTSAYLSSNKKPALN